MAEVNPGLAWINRGAAGATQLLASSSQSTHPVIWLKNQLRSMRWRSAAYWTIGSDNARINFNRGGVLTATIAFGTYTADELCAAIVTALEAADPTPVWACTYSTSTFKFTISTSAHSFTLLWLTGADAYRNCAKDLGFTVADTSSATSHTGANATYQSRHFVRFNLTEALGVSFACVFDHNSETGTATYTLQGHTSDAWSAPGVSQVLAEQDDIRVAYFTEESKQYWRLVVDDCGNDVGYAELKFWFGPHYEIPPYLAVGYAERSTELAVATYATFGSVKQDSRPEARMWDAQWIIPVPDKVTMQTFQRAVHRGKLFFFTLDQADLSTTVFVEKLAPMDFETVEESAGEYYHTGMTIREALG